MGGGAWWTIGAGAGAVFWVVVRSRVAATVETRLEAPSPRWLDAAGWAASIVVLSVACGATERTAEVPAIAGWAAGLVALGVIDAATRTLPTQLVWATAGWSVIALAPLAFADGEPERLGRAVAGALLAGAVVWGLRVLTRGGIGFGDVRLAVALGFVAAWRSWVALGQGGLWAVFVNGGVVVVLLVVGRAGRRSKVPLGPSLVAGALLAVLVLETTTT